MKNKTIIYYDFESTSVARDADPISLGMVAVTEEYKCNRSNCHIKKDKEWEDDTCDCLAGKITKHQEVKTLYCEFTDFNIEKCDGWVKKNIVNKLYLPHPSPYSTNFENQLAKGNQKKVSIYLKEWLSQFEQPCFIADYDVIDKPMLIDLIADWDTVEQSTTHIDINAIPSGISLEDFISNWKKYQTISTAITPPIQIEKVKTGLPKHLPNIKYDQFFDLHTMLWMKRIDTDINREEFVKKELMELIETQDLQNPIISFKIAGESHNALWDACVSWKVHQKLNNM